MSSAADRRQKILDAIVRAAELAKRDPADVRLIAVSKTRGAEEIEQLIQARRAARGARNFAEADKIRKDLDARGILLEDTATGTRWKRK